VEAGRITNPLEEIDAAEIYVPFSVFEPMCSNAGASSRE